ncbi:hypothetical protein TNCT_290231 [Trichonephila clavata]|uniref:Uncharacterized protein n=1 Tax=Trichonephila clavata TaxID=2740835 RepID=A0A8X6HMU6_TRICU|nr:hypothetical protein TNCT_290231 [Trichonephila clavata]
MHYVDGGTDRNGRTTVLMYFESFPNSCQPSRALFGQLERRFLPSSHIGRKSNIRTPAVETAMLRRTRKQIEEHRTRLGYTSFHRYAYTARKRITHLMHPKCTGLVRSRLSQTRCIPSLIFEQKGHTAGFCFLINPLFHWTVS